MDTENGCKTAMERLKAAFIAKGYVEWKPSMAGVSDVTLYRPDRMRSVYLGTYLNQFSIRNRAEGGPLLWTDLVSMSGARVYISQVYRHNGASKDVSVAVSVGLVDDKPIRLKSDYLSQEYVDLVRAESPTDYTKRGWEWSLSGSVCPQRVAKLRHDQITDRRIANIVAKVNAAVEASVTPDYSSFAENRDNWHRDTSGEVNAWRRAKAATLTA